MYASKNSRSLRTFEVPAVAVLLAALSAAAVDWVHRRGYTLYYGDALAHLNIARRIVDSRTPGYDQIGTVWLPLPHLLMLPLVSEDSLWRSGLAGAIPAAACFVAAGAFLFAAVRRALSSRTAAAAAVAVFALNPNALYLGSIPMTESAFFAALFGLAYFTVRFGDSQSLWAAAGAGIAAMAATLTRYEGWFLVPFVAMFLLWAGRGRRRWAAALMFGALACCGPLYWLGHNWWHYGDALEFYHGPYSAKAIYQRALHSGMQRYPGDSDWAMAVRYFLAAVRLCAGWPLALAGTAGLAAALWKRKVWPFALLALPPVFYVLSIHSAATPIFVPHLWPNSWYNTRYGLAALPVLAAGAALLVSLAGAKWRAAACGAVVATAVAPWVIQPGPESWVCWKESQVNSEKRRAWTHEAAEYLKDHYDGGGIITSFGDITGIFLAAGIPLRETLHSGNQPLWQAAVARPDLFLWEEWAVAFSADPVATAILRSRRDGPQYECAKMIALQGAPVIEIYRRIR